MASRTMISGSRRSPDHPSHPPRNLTRRSSEIRPSQTLNPSAPSFIPTSFEKQSPVRHKTPPHKLCSLNICRVNIRSLLAESRLIELESLCAAQNIDVLCLSETWLSRHPHVLNPVQVWSTFQDSSHPFDGIGFTAAAEESLSMSGMV